VREDRKAGAGLVICQRVAATLGTSRPAIFDAALCYEREECVWEKE
jgi:hypothetical protein